MELVFIKCEKCDASYVTEFVTGEHHCPECGFTNERYVFDEDITEEEVEFVSKVHKDILDVFAKHNIKGISNVKIIDLILGK